MLYSGSLCVICVSLFLFCSLLHELAVAAQEVELPPDRGAPRDVLVLCVLLLVVSLCYVCDYCLVYFTVGLCMFVSLVYAVQLYVLLRRCLLLFVTRLDVLVERCMYDRVCLCFLL